MKKYGLQLRVPASQQKKQPTRPPLPPPAGFRDDDGDEDDVEKEISRQSIKNRALKQIEEQHQKALEEDPSVFDYDGVYDEMKAKEARPRALDREERKPKYIQNLIKKAEERNREHEIVYERKLAKERSKDEHLYADKDKFVTSAYKKKLAEQAKWMQEERLRQLREEKEDVTKKSDLSDFYFSLEKNVAFGASGIGPRKLEKNTESKVQEQLAEQRKPEKHEEKNDMGPSGKDHSLIDANSHAESSRIPEEHQTEVSPDLKETPEVIDKKQVDNVSVPENGSVEPSPIDQPKRDHHKRNEDALAAAKARFLARKRAKEE